MTTTPITATNNRPRVCCSSVAVKSALCPFLVITCRRSLAAMSWGRRGWQPWLLSSIHIPLPVAQVRDRLLSTVPNIWQQAASAAYDEGQDLLGRNGARVRHGYPHRVHEEGLRPAFPLIKGPFRTWWQVKDSSLRGRPHLGALTGPLSWLGFGLATGFAGILHRFFVIPRCGRSIRTRGWRYPGGTGQT